MHSRKLTPIALLIIIIIVAGVLGANYFLLLKPDLPLMEIEKIDEAQEREEEEIDTIETGEEEIEKEKIAGIVEKSQCGNAICDSEESTLTCSQDCRRANLSHGAWTQTNGPYGGGVTFLIIQPDNSNRIYAGTDREGIFISDDAGRTWKNVIPAGAQSKLKHGNIQKLFLHSGTAALYALAELRGIFRSEDKGKTWEEVNKSGIQDILDFAVSPSDPLRLYVGTANGQIYRSSDGGGYWTETSSFPKPTVPATKPALTGFSPFMINTIAVDSLNPDFLYVGTNAGLYKSQDAGRTWKFITKGLYKSNKRTDVAFIAIDPLKNNRVYATFGVFDTVACDDAPPADPPPGEQQLRECGKIMRSDDFGETWTRIGMSIADSLTHDGQLFFSYPDTDRMYVVFGHEIYRSEDRGDTWEHLFGGSLYQDTADVDVLSVATDPKNPHVIYFGSRAGIYKSTDDGVTWKWRNEGLIDSEIYTIKVAPSDTNYIYAGTKCGTGMFRSTDGGQSWNWINYRLGSAYLMDIEVVPNDPRQVFVTTGGGIFYSSDAGDNWSQIKSERFVSEKGQFLPAPDQEQAHIHGMAIDPVDPKIMYVGAGGDEYGPRGGGLFKSVDGGESWSAINEGFITNVHVSSIEIDPLDRNTIYVATQGPTELFVASGPGEGVFKSTNGGKTWQQINNGLDVSGITWLAIHPLNSQILYAGTEKNGVYRTKNGGRSWQPVNKGLAMPTSVNQVYIDKKNPDTVYVATLSEIAIRVEEGLSLEARGVFVSYNGGESWQPYNQNLGTLDVFAIDGSSRALYLGTSGGGVYWRGR